MSKDEIICFKADPGLAEAIRNLPNRSSFIRAAVLSALQNACPLCLGTGLLTVEQKNHWQEFARHHKVKHCSVCNAVHLECDSRKRDFAHAKKKG